MQEPVLDLTLVLQDQVDNEELDLLTRQVRNEIAELDVETVRLARDEALPSGAKGDPIAIGTIVVALASAGVFTALIELLKSWALRREGRTVTIKVRDGEREIELAYSPADTSPEEMARFADKVVGVLQQGKRSTVGR